MSEIPDDIRKVVQALFNEPSVKFCDGPNDDEVAELILAERQRCAKIASKAAHDARKLVKTFGETTCAGFCAKTAEDIAAEILGD